MEALELLKSALALHGYSLLSRAEGMWIVPAVLVAHEAMTVKVVPLTYARAGELAYTLSWVAPPWVRIVPYYPTNSLVISGPPEAVEELIDIIKPRPVTDRLGCLLSVTLEAARIRANALPLPALQSWLDSWPGIGAVERGMARQDYNLQLTRYDERGWRATFSSGAQFDQTGLGALVDHADRFVYVSGWSWRTLRGMLRKARPGA